MPMHIAADYRIRGKAMKIVRIGLLLCAVLIIPGILVSQEENPAGGDDGTPDMTIPVQSQYSDDFDIKNVFLNKRIDVNGRGEILEVEMVLENNLDDPQDLYVFVVATYEVDIPELTSFDMPVPQGARVRSFVPYPGELENFQYEKTGDDGEKITALYKFPKDPKVGVDPDTNKPYHLNRKDLVIRTRHLSEYRNNYFFFNEVAILVFDSEGKPKFRQLYKIEGKRR